MSDARGPPVVAQQPARLPPRGLQPPPAEQPQEAGLRGAQQRLAVQQVDLQPRDAGADAAAAAAAGGLPQQAAQQAEQVHRQQLRRDCSRIERMLCGVCQDM